MATILLLTHRLDYVTGDHALVPDRRRNRASAPDRHLAARRLSAAELDLPSHHLITAILARLLRRGHAVWLAQGVPSSVPAVDAAILHGDATVVDAELVEFARTLPKVMNLAITDISKRRISDAAIWRFPDWTGPLMIKANRNYAGRPEVAANRRAVQLGLPVPYPGAVAYENYRILQEAAQLSEFERNSAELSVERFVPEIDPAGFAIRHWLFCGRRGYCSRYVAADPVIKGQNLISRSVVDVPDAIVERRRSLGLEYGKLDFVVVDGHAYLLDANKTPGAVPRSLPDYAQKLECLADGLEEWLQSGDPGHTEGQP